MKQKSLWLILFLAVCVCFSNVKANDFPVGASVENFTLPDINGKQHSFNDLKGEKGTIVVFLSVQCPVVKAYDERLNLIAADYKARGINFIGINSNSTENGEAVKTHAEKNYKFPVLIDKGNVIADKFNAFATPEMFFFNPENKLVYHGAIDNDRSGANVTGNFLRVAMDEVLAGKPVSKSETKAIGCTIKRVTN